MSARGARILVVDDEPAILRSLERNLRGHDFQVETATTAAEAVGSHERTHPDLVILDLGLPGPDGLSVIRALREASSTPIIVLSVRGADRDKVAALDLGADDYLTKPFSVDELLARIRAALRHVARPASGAAAIFRSGDLSVDLERRRVTVGDREVRLTPTEYELLRVLVRYPDRVVTAGMLLDAVWGQDAVADSHYLHVYVARLRQKIEPDPQHPRYIATEPGVGYRLLVEETRRSVI
ncbi:MAG: response regulator transcription factor [Chloroflexota bacterium]|nr:response regulator transcription factor [Chloroflexota bacterium]MDE3102133.1 response regulator transcription factor [Chloroflexota bacterium]